MFEYIKGSVAKNFVLCLVGTRSFITQPLECVYSLAEDDPNPGPG
jgi:hypothetical protein